MKRGLIPMEGTPASLAGQSDPARTTSNSTDNGLADPQPLPLPQDGLVSGDRGDTMSPEARAAAFEELAEVTDRIAAGVESVIEGKPKAVRLALTVLLAGGHLLIEDVPGVGKTVLSKTLARSIDCTVRRVQFTPDLLPSDITGVSVFNQETHDFEFRPGAIFANVVVGDEINRASPKTQSALLECMEERQVTVDSMTYKLPPPFLVIATQNPIEMEGTYPLPEAQRDRFMARISMGYPSRDKELAMIDHHGAHSPLDDLTPVTDAATVVRLTRTAAMVHVATDVKRYVLALVEASRRSGDLRLGASPRASLQLVRAARAWAALDGRDYVVPDDIQDLAVPVLAHRVIPSAEAHIAQRNTTAIIEALVRSVAVPRSTDDGPSGRAPAAEAPVSSTAR